MSEKISRWWNRFLDWLYDVPKDYVNPKLPRHKRGHLLFMVRTHRCGYCKGSGFDDIMDGDCSECDGTGFMNSKKHRLIFRSATPPNEQR